MSIPVEVVPEHLDAAGREDKRRHSRFGVATPALVSALGSKDAVIGTIADLSQAGLRLSLPAAFPVGEILRAEIGDEVFVAVVCYSRKTRDGYTIGTEMMHSIKRDHLNALVDEWTV